MEYIRIKYDQISKALLYPNCNIVYEVDVIHQCLQANFIYASRKGKNNEVVVTHSNRSDISIETVLINTDSYYVHELCNQRIIKLLLEPNRTFHFDMDIIQKCLQANLIYALRGGKGNKVIVTHSNRSDIPIGIVLKNIDSHFVNDLCNDRITKLLLESNRTFQFDIDIMQKCLQANSIYASRKGKINEVIVTHSNISSVPVGTVLLYIDSHDVHELNSNFTFRPRIVKNALTWLKINNHFYKPIQLHWYEDNFD